MSLPRGGLSPPTVAAPLRPCVAFLANEEKALPDFPAHSLLLTEVVCDTQAKIHLIEGRTESHFLQCNAPLTHNTGPYPTYTILGRFTPLVRVELLWNRAWACLWKDNLMPSYWDLWDMSLQSPYIPWEHSSNIARLLLS